MNEYKVATLMLRTTPMSIRVYVNELAGHMRSQGIEIVAFDDPSRIPVSDALWDPRTGGGRPPTAELVNAGRPLFVTLHDVAHLALPAREFYSDWRSAVRGRWDAMAVRRQWARSVPSLARIVVPSQVTRRECVSCLALPDSRITVIPHGVDHGMFNASRRQKASTRGGASPYFLHVSQYQKRKNIARLLAAYQRLPVEGRPRLVMKVIGMPAHEPIAGVQFIDREMSRDELADLFAGALCFVFPSVSEGFGMSIVEAMAIGCPTITSAGTACGEVAASAGLLVDPYSIDAIADALLKVWKDGEVGASLSIAGLEHASQFRWENAAEAHVRVIRDMLGS